MKLSEAIRLGAMMSPQGFRVTRENGRTCALGAALEAVGHTSAIEGWMPVYSIWPIAKKRVPHPVRGDEMMVGSACWILNDEQEWTREQIERAQEAQQPQPEQIGQAQ